MERLAQATLSFVSLDVVRYAPAKIPGLIESNDADLRNQAGETIAVLYEIAREINSVRRSMHELVTDVQHVSSFRSGLRRSPGRTVDNVGQESQRER